jgi:hypothetical protein
MGTSAPHRAKKTSNRRHPSRAGRPDAYDQSIRRQVDLGSHRPHSVTQGSDHPSAR